MKPKIVASIEARMGSSRLPGKVLMEIHGKPALTHLVDRLNLCSKIDQIVVATSTNHSDDAIESWAEEVDIVCYRGSEEDVLGRVVEAHEFVGSDIIVEITGDSILTDPGIVDLGVETYLNNDCDVVTNCGNVLTFPMGVYVQVFSLESLKKVSLSEFDKTVREHVSLYFYENPHKYNIIDLIAPKEWTKPNYRFQLDYPEDLQFLRSIYSRLFPKHGEIFGIKDIMELLKFEKKLTDINIHCIEKPTR